MKIIWRVAPVETGRSSWFGKRAWPSADYENGEACAMVLSQTAYSKQVDQAKSAVLSIRIADHSVTPWEWRKVIGEYDSMAEVKARVKFLLKKYPHFMPKAK